MFVTTNIVIANLNLDTMSTKTIKSIIPSMKINMGGIILDQPLPTKELSQIDPFLLIHHGALPVEKGGGQESSGVGPHPHRGFSPVTFVFQGEVQHQDSLGNNEVVKAGGTQWMHAGKGIVHSERPSKGLVENGGVNEIIQFWVNSPSKHKMEEPYYFPLDKSATPTINKDGSIIAVVAGEQDGVKGPAKTYSLQTLLRGEVKEGSEFTLNIPASYNTLIYLLDGSMEVGTRKVKAREMVWFNNDGEDIELKGIENTRFILLSGEPIGEELSTYGPFVMNTSREIQDAISDYQSGAMGELIETFE
jgi:redox-sensitive bicupin YhaK (pirin superfamily)